MQGDDLQRLLELANSEPVKELTTSVLEELRARRLNTFEIDPEYKCSRIIEADGESTFYQGIPEYLYSAVIFRIKRMVNMDPFADDALFGSAVLKRGKYVIEGRFAGEKTLLVVGTEKRPSGTYLKAILMDFN